MKTQQMVIDESSGARRWTYYIIVRLSVSDLPLFNYLHASNYCRYITNIN